MPGCVLRYCRNNSKNSSKCTGISFHRFPGTSYENREKWVKFVQKNRSEQNWLPSYHSYICSLHFNEEDKYVTKDGKHFLKKSAVPYEDKETDAQQILETISETVSESESVFDTPRIKDLKRKIRILTSSKIKLTDKIRKARRQNRNLQKKCESLTLLVKSLKEHIFNLCST